MRNLFKCNRGCFGGGGKAPSPTPPPAPAPITVEAQAGIVKTKDQLARLRYGLASTIKTGGASLLDKAVAGTQKKTLG